MSAYTPNTMVIALIYHPAGCRLNKAINSRTNKKTDAINATINNNDAISQYDKFTFLNATIYYIRFNRKLIMPYAALQNLYVKQAHNSPAS